MAHNYFKPKVIKRSAGQNAIKSAAYIDRAKYRDERTGKTWNYQKLGGLEFTGIFAPKNAPAWAKDPQRLWQEVEDREDRSKMRDTAQVARSFIIPLPHELNREQRKWLVTDFARELSRKGMVVHVAIHEPEEKNDQRNYHVHMMVTMREIGPDGFGNKVREWNDREEYKRWNERWSTLGARYLRRAGFEREADRFQVGHLPREQQAEKAKERGDHEWAHKKQGEPERHRGPAASGMKDRGERTHVDAQNDVIRERNAGRQMGGRGRFRAQAKGAERVFSKGIGMAAKTVEKALDTALSVFDSPKLTPQQEQDAEIARRDREKAGARAIRNRDGGRDR